MSKQKTAITKVNILDDPHDNSNIFVEIIKNENDHSVIGHVNITHYEEIFRSWNRKTLHVGDTVSKIQPEPLTPTVDGEIFIITKVYIAMNIWCGYNPVCVLSDKNWFYPWMLYKRYREYDDVPKESGNV